jgi:uncharacterized protein YqjF (DUF2071 family)
MTRSAIRPKASNVAEAALGRAWPGFARSGVLSERAHRPWPLPDGPWLMAQTWRDLLFAHWPVDAEALRPLIPAPLTLETWDGTAWLGITPFEVTGLRLHGTPPLPGVSRFPELNVRTYVTIGGKPGVWFFSLDAGSAAAVAAARRSYRLPYFHADMEIERLDSAVGYRSSRDDARLQARYAPAAEAFTAAAGTFDHFLTERYCLYAFDGRVLRAEIHHPPWPLQAASASFGVNTMAPVGLPAREPVVHFARRQDVVIWPPQTL